jgi:non-ribosomal peptide synthase protein (TIGR01720 family)
VELNGGENTEGSARTVKVRLSANATEALLYRAPVAYGTQINDLLLVALGRTLSEWAGTASLLIDLEGHGREDLFEGVDLSRTVGWFTSIYPVRLQAPVGGTAEWIKSVKEQLRSVPARGIGYGLQRYLAGDGQLSSSPEPQVLFNYLGQFDQVVGGSRLFGFANEPIGPWHSPLARRRHLLEVNCLVVNGQLELGWTYSENRNRANTIEQLAQRCLTRLIEIIQHCTASGVRGATPSDFPLVALDQVTVDALLHRVPELEDAYPLSPIQTLFYTTAANDSTAVTDHWHATLCGPLDVERFRRAWEVVFERHPVLRTSFQSAGLPEPLQVVHRGVTSSCRVEDWRGMSEQDQAARWTEMLEADRGQGMDLARAPLSRLAAVHLGDQRYKFLWTVPALLLDGWSWPVVFRELSQVYESLGSGTPLDLVPAPSYRNYVGWLQGRTWDETEDFWRGALSGVTEPTPLLAEIVTQPAVVGRQHARWSVALDPSTTSRLVQLARQLQLTPNTLIQAAWALVLTRLSGRKDVVFGAAFSGRPAHLSGVEDIVGPFVNNLPVRVRVDESSCIRSFLQELHSQLLQTNEYQFTPLARIQSWTDVPWRHRLFDSIVVVQNYMVDAEARRLGHGVSISDFVGPIHTNFPLLILVEPEETWHFTLIYDERELPEAAIHRWGQDLVRTLAEFVAKPEAGVGDLLAQLSTPVRSTPAKPRWRVSSQNHVAPQTELEGQLARVWEEMLQLERVSTEENLFDLGAHSLLVVQLHRRLCETTGQSFPLVAMFQFPTIQGLAKHLSEHDERRSSGEVRTRAQRQRDAISRMSGARK